MDELNNKILVIPDIHCRKFWRQSIEESKDSVDKVIFLGDYLDPYPEEIKMAPELMECKDFYDAHSNLNMLNDILSLKKENPDKIILLCGNHTCSYIWSKFSAASRTDYQNWEKYHKFFSQNLEYFNLVWTERNTIFSHAGITQGWAETVATELSLTVDLNNPIKSIARYLSNVSLNDILDKKLVKLLGNISRYRGGWSLNGSCEWCDIHEHFSSNLEEPIGEEGIYQIFGHTQLKEPLITDKWACVDCRQGFIFDTITYDCKNCF